LEKLTDFTTLFERIIIPDEMKPAFDERIKLIGAQTALIVTFLGVLLVPGSYIFDLLIIDARYRLTFLYVRIICTIACFLLFLIARTETGRNHGLCLSFITLLIVGVSSSMLIHTLGYDHSYYVMLIIIYIGAMIAPMTWQLCLYLCITIFLFYLVPIPFLASEPVNPGVLANNAGFQLETILIAVFYSHFNTRKRALQIINEQLITNQRDQISRNLTKIRNLQASRQQFIENITHDLKTPLSIISGHIDLVRTKLETIGDTSGDTFRFMTDAVIQSTRLLDQLTSIAMFDSGSHPSDMKAYDFTEFIRSFCGRFTILAEQSGVTFGVALPDEQLVVRMDLSWMERIIGNLVQNAFKYTPAGGSISVAVRKSGQTVVTEVRDTGYGIPEDKIPLVFERKYQASEEDRKMGFGLGLSIVRDMINRMDGTIELRSEVGKGSVFSFVMPFVTDQDTTLIGKSYSGSNDIRASLDHTIGEELSEKLIDELQGVSIKGRPTLLICEDTPGQLHLLVEALRPEYNLIIARNGEEGLEKVHQYTDAIDLIISDVRMPIMDGIEFCRRFFAEETRQFTPFIFLTAYANEHEHYKSLSYGATDYLQKPFNQRILREKINHWLMRRRHEQLLEQMINDLEKKNEMISRFRSIISHEIRNPLSALYGVEHYLETLRDEVYTSLDPKHQRYWDNVEKAVSIAENINGVLDTVKNLEQTVSASTCRPEPTEKVISDIMEQVEYFTEEQRINVANTVPMEITVVCDISMVRQIMVNLLRNAIEAVRESGKPGEVTLASKTEESHLVISITDTGVGMSDTQRKNLFKYKATTKKDGNGIGLYLSMKLLQLQNGIISCESREGKGTTFIVKLPLATPENSQ
jgi:signal transduction histidine kinase